jgi:hypothetical protein
MVLVVLLNNARPTLGSSAKADHGTAFGAAGGRSDCKTSGAMVQ